MQGLSSDSASVRRHVLLGLAYVPWSGDLRTLRTVAKSDGVAELQALAKASLSARSDTDG